MQADHNLNGLYDSNNSTGKETGKTHLCAVVEKSNGTYCKIQLSFGFGCLL